MTQRNGTRPRTLTATAGELDLRIPKLRQGTFVPSLLVRRRRVDEALFAVVMEAYVHLVKALGADTGISKSEVSRICANLDEDVAAFRDRPLADQACPYGFLDATYCKARVAGGWCRWRSWSSWAWPRTAAARSSALRSARPSRSCSGPRSCGR